MHNRKRKSVRAERNNNTTLLPSRAERHRLTEKPRGGLHPKGLVTTLQLSWRHGKPVADEETATRVSEGNRVLHQQHERGVINLQYRAVSQARGREQRYDSPLARTMKSKSRPFLDLPAIESRPPTSEPNVCTTVQHTTRGQP